MDKWSMGNQPRHVGIATLQHFSRLYSQHFLSPTNKAAASVCACIYIYVHTQTYTQILVCIYM